MPENDITLDAIKGLSEREVQKLLLKFGKNRFTQKHTPRFIRILLDVVKEPMFVLLVVACILYFILGAVHEGITMLIAILLVSAISVYQEVKSANALHALKQLTDPKVTVMRDGKLQSVASETLVPGDIVVLEEGVKVPADATILQENDLTVNEAIITGESFPVEKTRAAGNNILYQGATINSGKCYALVTSTGNRTMLGKLGKSIDTIQSPTTLLHQQINHFVKRLAYFGVVGFLIVFIFNYFRNGNILSSFLFSLTLAMAVIPEEIPVAFSSFMALGAFRLSKLGIISRHPGIVENLGAVTVICLDKTGTITENIMQVENLYDYKNDTLLDLSSGQQMPNHQVLKYAMLASEKNPFDAMEKAIWEAYTTYGKGDPADTFTMIHEYNLEGKPPMMTHVYHEAHTTIAAAKGAVERIVRVCQLNESDLRKIHQLVSQLTSKGSRVIAVASAVHIGDTFPEHQDDFNWKLEGLLSLYDPPKANIKAVFQQYYKAGIKVKLVTGDYAETAVSVANQVGLLHNFKYLVGDEVLKLSKESLQEAVKVTDIFARMFPDAKLKVIEALKANGEIVAMTGDGVNDGPALKASDIGIALGMKGTEIARQSADLILTDDNLEKVVEAIREGRKIFYNLKKAVRYIISIHVPIILVASIPIVLGWKYPNIFTPVHVIFLELIMGPTCSIFFEREPVEATIMNLPPRKKTEGLFTKKELAISIWQGVVIAAVVLVLYFVYMKKDYLLQETRTIVFTTLIISNLLLTFVNRSFSESLSKTIKYKNNLALPVLLFSIGFLMLVLLVPVIRSFFGFMAITTNNLMVCLAASVIGVMWIELYKAKIRNLVKKSGIFGK